MDLLYAHNEGLHTVTNLFKCRTLMQGTPKLHKEGKNVARMPVKTPHFSTLTVTRILPPPFRNPVSAPVMLYVDFKKFPLS